jgi:hypothetical protein
MEKLQFKYERELGKDIFVYSISMKGEIIHRMVGIEEGNPIVKEERIDNKTIRLNLKVPKKKVVYCTDTSSLMDYEEAELIYKKEYLEKYTRIIDDVDKFEETHQKGYKMLYDKFKEII